MGFMETSLMRQLGKLVEVVRHAYETLSDGYRLCVVSADHLAVQGGLTNAPPICGWLFLPSVSMPHSLALRTSP